MSERVTVGLGQRSYDIHVGSGMLPRSGELIAAFARGPVPVVTDLNVAQHHLDALSSSLRSAGVDAAPIILEPGEGTKSFARLEGLISSLLKTGVDRDGLVIALGGGVVGDITGFACAILKRGVDFAQIPTTLLAQVDSSVGGKTAINTAEGKNLVGVFHQPRIVIADTAVLSTLPRRQLVAGYAEVVKYGALGDAGFFSRLESHGASALRGDAEELSRLVAHSCRMKADIVARDEREAGDRALLNLGHTFGHALEAATGYSDRLLHGEAIAIGMVLAFRLSASLGLCAHADAERLEALLRAGGLPTRIADIPGARPDTDSIIDHMTHDKKVKRGKTVFVLSRGIGSAFVTSDVPAKAVRSLVSA